MKYDRGGTVIKTGKIGRVNILRQQILLPGETVKPALNGPVRLTALRERESLKIHARLEAFVQPIRWLWDDLPAYLQEGPAGTKTWPTTATQDDKSHVNLSDYGVGGNTSAPMLAIFRDGPLRIYNEWFKWPEDADETSWVKDGRVAIAQAHSWTRMQANDGPATGDYDMQTVASGQREQFDIRGLAEIQARLRQAIDQDWIAHGRYVDLLKELWQEGGSREVDKVPMRLNGAEAGVDPQNVYATDSDGLGDTMSLYNFGVDHRFGTVSMPEHSLLTYMLVVRFASIAEDEINPTAIALDRSWASMVGEPGMLAAERPNGVRGRNLTGNNAASTVLGYLPAGWQWRSRWNVVGDRIDDRDSFPVYRSLSQQTATSMRSASRIGDPFRSASLGDYYVDINFSEVTNSPIPGPLSSLYTGSDQSGGGSSYPYPGPRKVI